MQHSNFTQQFAYAPRHPIPPVPHWPVVPGLSVPGKGAMEIGGLLNARSAAAVADAHLRQQLQQTMQMNSHSAYAMNHPGMGHHQSHHAMGQPASMRYPHLGQAQHQQMLQGNYMSTHHDGIDMEQNNGKPKGEPAPKAFACSTCSKGFARRSDLARHERIHSGDRPHKCDFPGCGKEFIQRSALTVHSRVHTGEKPHMCERCGKPFSDSSSLARHRRIHSGKRPYKCPYANCQKTFTRRTTLTRHQNHHTGTIEQAAAETNAKLSISHPSGQARSADGSFSDLASTGTSATSPSRPLSISPSHDLPQVQHMQRQGSDFQYMAQSQSIPNHMRNEYQRNVNRAPPSMSAPPPTDYNNVPQQRPTMTSHPSAFGPPPTLEPRPNSTTSGGVSPHMATMGWASPGNNGIHSPSGMDPYGYPDAAYGAQQLYYPGSNIRRPQSTEPEDYGIRARHMNHMGNSMSMGAEWSAIPNMHEIKQERAYAM